MNMKHSCIYVYIATDAEYITRGQGPGARGGGCRVYTLCVVYKVYVGRIYFHQCRKWKKRKRHRPGVLRCWKLVNFSFSVSRAKTGNLCHLPDD